MRGRKKKRGGSGGQRAETITAKYRHRRKKKERQVVVKKRSTHDFQSCCKRGKQKEGKKEAKKGLFVLASISKSRRVKGDAGEK